LSKFKISQPTAAGFSVAVGFVYDKKCFIMRFGRLKKVAFDNFKNFFENPLIFVNLYVRISNG